MYEFTMFITQKNSFYFLDGGNPQELLIYSSFHFCTAPFSYSPCELVIIHEFFLLVTQKKDRSVAEDDILRCA